MGVLILKIFQFDNLIGLMDSQKISAFAVNFSNKIIYKADHPHINLYDINFEEKKYLRK